MEYIHTLKKNAIAHSGTQVPGPLNLKLYKVDTDLLSYIIKLQQYIYVFKTYMPGSIDKDRDNTTWGLILVISQSA